MPTAGGGPHCFATPSAADWDTNLVPNVPFHHQAAAGVLRGDGASVGESSSTGTGGSSESDYLYGLREDDCGGPGKYVQRLAAYGTYLTTLMI